MKRSTLRRLGRFLPESVRSRARQHFLGQSIAGITARVEIDESPTGLVCRVDDTFSFSAPLAAQKDLQHYAITPEGRAEFGALAGTARDPGGVLFDIGAHCGLVSTLWCAARPSNRAFSFEPSPSLGRRLFEIRDLNQFGDRMTINQVGIGAANGTAAMLMDPVGGFVQSRHFDHTMWSAPQSIEVPIETIQAATERLRAIPNCVKIDIEGYEFEAIEGSSRFLAQHKPVLFLELHLNYLEQRKLRAQEVVELLQECGYAFFTYGGTELRAAEIYESPLAIYHLVAR